MLVPEEELLIDLLDAIRGGDVSQIARSERAARESGISPKVVDAVRTLAPPRPPMDRSLAAGLEIALLAERHGGVAPLSSTAEQHLGIGFGGDLAAAISRITAAPPDDPSLRAVIARARQTGAANATVRVGAAQWRVHAYLVDKELRVALAPVGTSDAHAMQTLATLNHEMANGITALASLAAVARHPASSPAFVADSLRRIERTAEDTLDVVRSARRQGRRALSERPAPVDCAPILRDLVANFQAVAQTSGVTVETRISGELHTSATQADLRSILWNLIKNAIEAVGEGGRVRVGAQSAPTHVRIVVDDDGPGMGSTHQSQAFEPYFTTKANGSGLGLPLVRHLITRLGGELVVESEMGRGTRMVVSLPLVQPKSDTTSSGFRNRYPFRGLDVLLMGPAAQRLNRALELLGANLHFDLDQLPVVPEDLDLVLVDATILDTLDPTHVVWLAEHVVPVGSTPQTRASTIRLELDPTPDQLVGCLSELFPFRVIAARR